MNTDVEKQIQKFHGISLFLLVILLFKYILTTVAVVMLSCSSDEESDSYMSDESLDSIDLDSSNKWLSHPKLDEEPIQNSNCEVDCDADMRMYFNMMNENEYNLHELKLGGDLSTCINDVIDIQSSNFLIKSDFNEMKVSSEGRISLNYCCTEIEVVLRVVEMLLGIENDIFTFASTPLAIKTNIFASTIRLYSQRYGNLSLLKLLEWFASLGTLLEQCRKSILILTQSFQVLEAPLLVQYFQDIIDVSLSFIKIIEDDLRKIHHDLLKHSFSSISLLWLCIHSRPWERVLKLNVDIFCCFQQLSKSKMLDKNSFTKIEIKLRNLTEMMRLIQSFENHNYSSSSVPRQLQIFNSSPFSIEFSMTYHFLISIATRFTKSFCINTIKQNYAISLENSNDHISDCLRSLLRQFAVYRADFMSLSQSQLDFEDNKEYCFVDSICSLLHNWVSLHPDERYNGDSDCREFLRSLCKLSTLKSYSNDVLLGSSITRYDNSNIKSYLQINSFSLLKSFDKSSADASVHYEKYSEDYLPSKPFFIYCSDKFLYSRSIFRPLQRRIRELAVKSDRMIEKYLQVSNHISFLQEIYFIQRPHKWDCLKEFVEEYMTISKRTKFSISSLMSHLSSSIDSMIRSLYVDSMEISSNNHLVFSVSTNSMDLNHCRSLFECIKSIKITTIVRSPLDSILLNADMHLYHQQFPLLLLLHASHLLSNILWKQIRIIAIPTNLRKSDWDQCLNALWNSHHFIRVLLNFASSELKEISSDDENVLQFCELDKPPSEGIMKYYSSKHSKMLRKTYSLIRQLDLLIIESLQGVIESMEAFHDALVMQSSSQMIESSYKIHRAISLFKSTLNSSSDSYAEKMLLLLS